MRSRAANISALSKRLIAIDKMKAPVAPRLG
jgi:hypothetical protein